MRVEMDPSAWGHHHVAGLEEGPFVIANLHRGIVDGVAVDGASEIDLTSSERTGAHATCDQRVAGAGSPAAMMRAVC